MPFESHDVSTITSNGKPAGSDRSGDAGHFLEQVVPCGHAGIAAARAAIVAMNEELSRLGVVVDFVTGLVTVRRA